MCVLGFHLVVLASGPHLAETGSLRTSCWPRRRPSRRPLEGREGVCGGAKLGLVGKVKDTDVLRGEKEENKTELRSTTVHEAVVR